MQLCGVPWARVTALYVTMVVCFFLYGHSQFYRDPGSLFFKESRAYERKYSEYRQKEVEDAQKEVHHLQKSATNATATICASFLSVKRQGLQTLPLAVASALHGLSDCERQDLYVNVLIAHTNTTEHPSSTLQWFTDHVDSLHGYNLPEAELETLKQLELKQDFSTKAVQDYIHALKDCYNSEAEWIIIFEDDILLADGWFIKIKQATQNLVNQLHPNDDWVFMRLFNQERSIGWESHKIGGNNEFLIAIPISLTVFTILCILRKRFQTLRTHFDNAILAVICLLAIPTFIVLFFQSGKANMLPPRPGVRKEDFGCCAQGMLFPRHQVARITEYLNFRQRGQIDIMLDELAVNDTLDRYALYPVQLQHVGQNSVRGTVPHEAQAIWSMAFEDLRPQKLHDEHIRLLEDIFDGECTIA